MTRTYQFASIDIVRRKNNMAVFVFDADDTLWMNEWQYSHATTKFFFFLYEIFRNCAPNFHAIRERFYEIDKSLYPQFGTRRGRIAEAMVLTYREVGAWIEKRFGANLLSLEHEREIREIGDLPFDYTQVRWLSDACLVLSELESRGHKLCLLSSYDPEVFPRRANYLGINNYFEPNHILATEQKKGSDHFVQVSGWKPELDAATQWYAVGNGQGDILPALEISNSWCGFYIPHGSTSWYVGHEPGYDPFTPPPLEHPRVITVPSIKKILEHIA